MTLIVENYPRNFQRSVSSVAPNIYIYMSSISELLWDSLVAQLVNNPPAMRETWVQSLCWEDLLEKGKAIHSNILALREFHGVYGL